MSTTSTTLLTGAIALATYALLSLPAWCQRRRCTAWRRQVTDARTPAAARARPAAIAASTVTSADEAEALSIERYLRRRAIRRTTI